MPNLRTIRAHLGAEPDEGAVKQLVRNEIERIAREEGLQRWEVPRELLVETTPFTRENGLLTASSKPSRPKLKERYGERLDQVFAQIERTQLEKLHALEAHRADASVADQVALAVQVTLGLHDIDLGQGFTQLGGDSLSAVRLSSILEDRFGFPVPVGLILDPTSTVASLVSYVEQRAAGASFNVTFDQIHGAGATVVRADDLRIDRFLAPDEIAAVSGAAAIAPEVRVAFLTGANGFLGKFLLLELLERVPRKDGKVVCVVRAPSDHEARARLAAAYRADPLLEQRFEKLAEGGRLEALAGDLMKPRFGLSEEVFDRLCAEVDGIVHNGALVNHAFSYPQLFEPNVLGTVEVIRLALRKRLKSIGYVSTVGVAGGLARRDPVRESEDARSLWKERPIDSGYAVGYATSKWAGEVLLADVSDRFGVPTSVFRCSMIMPHAHNAGQVNAGDFLTRLFVGIVDTGVAPRSFYADPAAKHHFDGLPVDFVAGSIAAIAMSRGAGHATYHVTNPRWDDGVSLDTMVGWIRKAGYPIQRLDDHARWFETFRARLEALPPAEKQRSPLPIVQQWSAPLDREIRFDASRLQQRLRELAARPNANVDATIPRLTAPYIHKYLHDMILINLIAPPGDAVAAAE
ncbi:MAG: thioester reductase domain-containing protein [Minicystis sp.]